MHAHVHVRGTNPPLLLLVVNLQQSLFQDSLCVLHHLQLQLKPLCAAVFFCQNLHK